MKKRIFGREQKSSNSKIAIYATAFCMLAFVFAFFSYDLPKLDDIEAPIQKLNVTLESFDGEKIAVYNIEQRSQPEEIPNHVANAVVAAFGDNMYLRNDLNIKTAAMNLLSNSAEKTNGQYIIHQVTRNLFPYRSRSLKRKVQEYVLQKKLESSFSKKQLLSIYLSKAYFGFGIFGVYDAAHFFFKKSISQLSLYEAAKLAAILANGYANTTMPTVKTVLSIMKGANYISDDEFNDAILSCEKSSSNISAQYADLNKNFADFVMDQAEQFVNFRKQGNIVIQTTLDSRLQKNAAEIIGKFLEENGVANRISQAALVSIDKVGAIRAMIGGVPPENALLNRTIVGKPAGSLVNFFIYAAALDSGIDITDSIKANPITIDAHLYKLPDNIEKDEVPLINAYINSIEICAIRLAEKVGTKNISNKTRAFGIDGLAMKDISSALGTDEISLLDLSSCFGAVIHEGRKVNPFGIISIKNSRGEELYRAQKFSDRIVISNNSCEKMKMLLRESIRNGNSKDAEIPELESLGQSGFFHDDRNASFIGIVDPLITGVWIGNDNNIPMINNNSNLPAKIWKNFTAEAFKISHSPRKKLTDLLKQTVNNNPR